MKAVQSKDLVIGAIYLSANKEDVWKYVGRTDAGNLSFEHLKGPCDGFIKNEDGNYPFTDMYEGYPDTLLSPSEIEQYLAR